jgi:hypothetical protein
VRINIQNLDIPESIVMSRLAKLVGNTGLLDINTPPYTSPPNIDWSTVDITGTIDPSNFTMVFPRASITVITFHRNIRKLPDNIPVSLGGMVVTANYPSENYMYVESENRTFGIRVLGTFPNLAIGDRVTVSGKISTRKTGSIPIERQITYSIVNRLDSGEPLKPLGMNCRSICGGPIGTAPGAKYGFGLNNVGLLVTITGKVTAKSGNFIFVDDGTNIADPQGRATVAVKCPVAPTVSVGDIVRVTGVVEGNIPSGWTENRRYIRARTSEDILLVN